jgi:hypothetical protein
MFVSQTLTSISYFPKFVLSRMCTSREQDDTSRVAAELSATNKAKKYMFNKKSYLRVICKQLFKSKISYLFVLKRQIYVAHTID